MADEGLDGLGRVKLSIFVARARLAYPTVLPPPGDDIVRLKLARLRRRLLERPAGRTDGAPP